VSAARDAVAAAGLAPTEELVDAVEGCARRWRQPPERVAGRVAELRLRDRLFAHRPLVRVGGGDLLALASDVAAACPGWAVGRRYAGGVVECRFCGRDAYPRRSEHPDPARPPRCPRCGDIGEGPGPAATASPWTTWDPDDAGGRGRQHDESRRSSATDWMAGAGLTREQLGEARDQLAAEQGARRLRHADHAALCAVTRMAAEFPALDPAAVELGDPAPWEAPRPGEDLAPRLRWGNRGHFGGAANEAARLTASWADPPRYVVDPDPDAPGRLVVRRLLPSAAAEIRARQEPHRLAFRGAAYGSERAGYCRVVPLRAAPAAPGGPEAGCAIEFEVGGEVVRVGARGPAGLAREVGSAVAEQLVPRPARDFLRGAHRHEGGLVRDAQRDPDEGRRRVLRDAAAALWLLGCAEALAPDDGGGPVDGGSAWVRWPSWEGVREYAVEPPKRNPRRFRDLVLLHAAPPTILPIPPGDE
jgi:hypothetical protein